MNTSDLRATFNEDAERYSRFRPQYPEALSDKLVKDAGIHNYSELLEIGLGTGQATKPLAKTGATITAIELGAALADKARKELRQYPNVHIMTGAFEKTDLPASHYDLIYSATAFHWIKDEYKFSKTARLLKPNGYLAIIHTEHVSDDCGDTFHTASRPIYDMYWPLKDPTKPPILPQVQDLKPPHIDSAVFKLQSFTTFAITKVYSAADYAGLLSTYSRIIALPPAQGRHFLAAIEAFINEQFGGELQKRFAFTLAIAQKK
jgi:SAM-dependent methyltransferase